MNKQRKSNNPVTVVIECPKGSAYKYDFDEKNSRFKLSKLLPAGMVFPFDFGFIPGTKGDDGDPLDIIVLSELKTFTGCSIDCRIIGVLCANQTERNGRKVRNDRFLGVPEVSIQFGQIESIEQLPGGIVDELEEFFVNYNNQAGKKFEPLSRGSQKEASKMLGR